jgi:hypothetical protein
MAKYSNDSEVRCRAEIERMLRNSQTKIIAPIITLALLREHAKRGILSFTDGDIRKIYGKTVAYLKEFLGHDFHIGAKYYDAYGSRMSRYGVLRSVAHLQYELQSDYSSCARSLIRWIPGRIRQHIDERLGIVPSLGSAEARVNLAANRDAFLTAIRDQIAKTPANFEVFSFAVLKVHLEKFACRIYRDTRTASHDAGVDISTNFGVVYQIKKLQIYTQAGAKRLYAELKSNFDRERLQDGNVIVVIDDISKSVRDYLINLRVQSISRQQLLALASNFDEVEDRQKVLRIVFEEFRREYSEVG